MSNKKGETIPQKTAPELFQEFLNDNNIVLDLEVQKTGFVKADDGFLMTDKPLLKVTPKFRK